jgi:MFS family permease
VAWMVIFFFASAAASSAYLTVSETFPLEIRALAIAFFYAIGTGIGGVGGPWLFGLLIDTGSRWSVFGGYLLGAALMIVLVLSLTGFDPLLT